MTRPPRDATRRRIIRAIGGGGAAALAGCLSPTPATDSCVGSDEGTLSLDEATATGVSNEFSAPLDMLPYATRVAAADAVAATDGEATVRGYYVPDPRTAFVVTGRGTGYYRLRTTERDRARTTGYEYAVDIDVDDDASLRSVEELPARDRESLRGAIGSPRLLRAPHYTSFSVVFAYEEPEARERSAFVPPVGTRYLEWDGVPLGATFEERRTVEIASVTVTAERVAASPSEFREHVGERRGVVLDSLPADERDVVDRAIGGTYAECEPYSEPFGDLRERLSTGDGEPASLVRYDGDWYFCSLS